MAPTSATSVPGSIPARVRVLGGEAIAPGETGLVRLHLAEPLPLLPGDRYVLRESGRAETVGGGEVLDVAPVLPASKARPDRSVERVVAERGWVLADDLEALTGERAEPTLGPWVVAPGVVDAMAASLAARCRSCRRRSGWTSPRSTTVSAPRSRLCRVSVVEQGRAKWPGRPTRWPTTRSSPRSRPGGFSPPGAEGVDRAELRELVRRGLVVERDGVCFAPSTIDAAAAVAASLLARQPAGVHRERAARRGRHHPQARAAAGQRAGRARHHPSPGRPAHRRAALAERGSRLSRRPGGIAPRSVRPMALPAARSATRRSRPAPALAPTRTWLTREAGQLTRLGPPATEQSTPRGCGRFELAGHLGHVQVVRDDLDERVRVGQQPRVAAVDHRALRCRRRCTSPRTTPWG